MAKKHKSSVGNSKKQSHKKSKKEKKKSKAEKIVVPDEPLIKFVQKEERIWKDPTVKSSELIPLWTNVIERLKLNAKDTRTRVAVRGKWNCLKNRFTKELQKEDGSTWEHFEALKFLTDVIETSDTESTSDQETTDQDSSSDQDSDKSYESDEDSEEFVKSDDDQSGEPDVMEKQMKKCKKTTKKIKENNATKISGKGKVEKTKGTDQAKRSAEQKQMSQEPKNSSAMAASIDALQSLVTNRDQLYLLCLYNHIKDFSPLEKLGLWKVIITFVQKYMTNLSKRKRHDDDSDSDCQFVEEIKKKKPKPPKIVKVEEEQEVVTIAKQPKHLKASGNPQSAQLAQINQQVTQVMNQMSSGVMPNWPGMPLIICNIPSLLSQQTGQQQLIVSQRADTLPSLDDVAKPAPTLQDVALIVDEKVTVADKLDKDLPFGEQTRICGWCEQDGRPFFIKKEDVGSHACMNIFEARYSDDGTRVYPYKGNKIFYNSPKWVEENCYYADGKLYASDEEFM